jgi:hypothetical protein
MPALSQADLCARRHKRCRVRIAKTTEPTTKFGGESFPRRRQPRQPMGSSRLAEHGSRSPQSLLWSQPDRTRTDNTKIRKSEKTK